MVRRRARIEGMLELRSHAEKAVTAKLTAKLEAAARAWNGAKVSLGALISPSLS